MNRDNAFIIAALSFIPPCRRWTALFCPLLPPCYPFLFTLFCPQRIHCRCRVVGGYRQPVGISVSTRARVGGWMSFVKVPSLLFSSLFPGSFAGCFPPPLQAGLQRDQPSSRPAPVHAALLKGRRGDGSSSTPLFGRGRGERDYVRVAPPGG